MVLWPHSGAIAGQADQGNSTMTTATALPSGGPSKLSANLSAAIIAQLELMCCFDRVGRREHRANRRDDLLLKLDEKNKGLLRAIGRTLERLGSA